MHSQSALRRYGLWDARELPEEGGDLSLFTGATSNITYEYEYVWMLHENTIWHVS